MKKTLLTIGLACGLAIPAFANLGDTRAQSDNRYGTPQELGGNFLGYRVRDWWIVEWFNPSGVVEVIWYNKAHGQVTTQDINKAVNANTPRRLHRGSVWKTVRTDYVSNFRIIQCNSVDGSHVYGVGYDSTKTQFAWDIEIATSWGWEVGNKESQALDAERNGGGGDDETPTGNGSTLPL
jgi:hypothetical protein